MRAQPYKVYKNAAKSALRGTFIAIQGFFKILEKSQINNLTHHLK